MPTVALLEIAMQLRTFSSNNTQGSQLLHGLQVSNMLDGHRFKLQNSAKKLQECMNNLEKEHAWQGYNTELSSRLEQHQALIQVCLCHLIHCVPCHFLVVSAKEQLHERSQQINSSDHIVSLVQHFICIWLDTTL